MSDIADKAQQARRLLSDETFLSVIDEIRSDAIGVFSDANCDIDRIAKAHEKMRATQTFLDVLQSRIDAQAVKEKKDRHRAND